MTVNAIGAMNNRFIGLSTDTKPTTDVSAGATILEYDTGSLFVYTGSNWILKLSPDHLFATTTIDLNQAADDYDLFTVGGTDIPVSMCQVLEFGLIIPADLTGTAAGSLTSISVQSTDTTPVELISSTAGAKANLAADAHLLYAGAGKVASAKKIQLTIAGGATAAAQVCNVWIKYQDAF